MTLPGEKKTHNSRILPVKMKDSVLESASFQTRNDNNEPPNSTNGSSSSLHNESVDSTVSCFTVSRGSFGRIGLIMSVVSKQIGFERV